MAFDFSVEKETSTELPDKLSDLIDVALRDLELCEADPRYRIFMGDWHQPFSETVCNVCLAGAVMAKTRNFPRSADIDNIDYVPDANKYRALDAVRVGDVDEALSYMGQVSIDYEPDVTRYSVNPRQFKADLRGVSKRLKSVGL